jgi:hypothetical protein
MTGAEWLACTDPQPMLNFLQGSNPLRAESPVPPLSARKLRLFACACDTNQGSNRRSWWMEAMESAIDDPTLPVPRVVRAYFADPVRWVRSYFVGGWPCEQSTVQAALLRDLVGNPFRPVPCLDGHAPTGICQNSAILAWKDGTVVRMARTIYDNHFFEDMPILADALEESGCTNADVLNHCRGPGPHARGCWVVDLLLGKS